MGNRMTGLASAAIVAIAAMAAAAAIAPGCAAHAANPSRAPALYVDCEGGAGGGTGTKQQPLTSLGQLNRIRLQPGTHVYFKRGATCHGSFKPAPGSSGTRAAPIVVDTYGSKALPRPVIAAGCTSAVDDPKQLITEAAKTLAGISPYHALCKAGTDTANSAAIHLYNVEYWEINGLELTNDGMSEAGRVGLLVQLEDFGTGRHYRVNDVYVHHVRGYLEDVPGRTVPYKTTGGMLFHVTRDGEAVGVKQRKTNFDGITVENSEIYHVDGIGLATRAAWMCRPNGAPCGDYPPYKGNPAYMNDPATGAAGDYFPSQNIVLRNNKIHDVGGDGIVVRTAAGARIESNLLYDIWMRAPGNSAGAWAINTDDALFQFNEIHHTRLREHIEPGDGMAFDADMGTRNTRFVANYSHDNEGGMMLFCGCGNDGLGGHALASNMVVERNLSVNDGRRIIAAAGTDGALVTDNLVITSRPGLVAPIVENLEFAPRNALQLRHNTFVHASGMGAQYRTRNPQAGYGDIVWDGNTFIGYEGAAGAGAADVQALVEQWFERTGFSLRRFSGPHQPAAATPALPTGALTAG